MVLLMYSSMQAHLIWPNISSSPASFSILSPLLTSDEVSSILSIVADPSIDFDTDADTVDNMETHEIYLQRSGSVDAIRDIGGKPDADPAVFEYRKALRDKLNTITEPIIRERILPFINSRYPAACGIMNQSCHVCHSLV